MKAILMTDKENFKAEIERRIENCHKEYESCKEKQDNAGMIHYAAVKAELEGLLTAINAEPNFKIGDTIKHKKSGTKLKVLSVNSGSYYCQNIATGGNFEIFDEDSWELVDDLDEEILAFLNKHYTIRNDETLECCGDPLTTQDFEDIARHFAGWQATKSLKVNLNLLRQGTEAYEKGKSDMKQQMMKNCAVGYVIARNKNCLHPLRIYDNIPKRYACDDGREFWMGNDIRLPDTLFPEITWEDEPKKVKLIIIMED